MSTVREAVNEALDSNGMTGYRRQAEPVIAMLETRDAEVAERLAEAGVDMGGDRTQVRSLLMEVGLLAPPPVAVAQTNGASTGGDEDRMARMERNIETLLQVARSRGLLPNG